MWRSRVVEAVAFLGVALFAFGCGAGTFRSPADGGRRWVELSTDHFVVQTDLSDDGARDALARFESFRAALEQVAFPSASQPRGRTRVTLFASEDDYEAVVPEKFSGHFVSRGQLLNPEPHVVIPQSGGQSELTRAIQHELVHRYVAFHLPGAPIWLNEGLAELYSTLEARDGKAVFGSAPSFAPFAMGTGAEIYVHSIRMDLSRYAPSVEALLAMDRHHFYAHDSPTGSAAFFGHRLAHYSMAWALTHVLVLGDERRRTDFLRYLNLLKQGEVSAKEAWQRALSSEVSGLELAVKALVSGEETYTGTMDFTPSSLENVRSRNLSAAEVHRLWAEVRRWSSLGERNRARQDIERARALDPSDVKALVLLGYWHEHGGDLRAAEATFRDAVARAPEDADALFALSSFHFRVEDRRPSAVRAYETIDPLVSRLEKVATGARHWNFVAWHWAVRKEPGRGLPFANRAVKADSSCVECVDTLALIHFQSGDVAAAARAQRVAVHLSDSEDRGMLERLDAFDRALANLRDEIAASDPEDGAGTPAPLDPSCKPARAVTTPPPEYPAEALRNDVEGTVLVELVVLSDGRPSRIRPLKGPASLVDSALHAVEHWTFEAARCEGRPVPSLTHVRLPFRLMDAGEGR